MIILGKTKSDNKELLIIKNVGKITIVEIAKIFSIINNNNKHGQAISNNNINVAKNLKLTNIKKYERYINQI